jgi:hypothetical protein
VLVPCAGPARDAGHAAIAVELPSDDPAADRARYVATVDAALAAAPGAVLIAHSMSGLVGPSTTGAPALVMLAAMVPERGTAWIANGADPYAVPMREGSARMHLDDQGPPTQPT